MEVTLASLTELISGIGSAMTWFWGIFTDLINTVATNSLLLYSVGLAIVIGTIGIGFKVVRKFGLKGRRS